MAIRIAGVSKRFGDFVALDDVSLNIPDGELTALLGPSGSGKSTLLRIIAGLETPDAGTVWLGEQDVTHVPPQQRGIGFVFQHYAPFKHMTVRDNVAFGLTIRKRPKAEIDAKVNELLQLVQIEQFADRYPAQLSGGQRQRMALARALAVEPEVLLLDEPFGALDARVRKELRVWLRRLHDETHVTTVFVTHDQEEAMDVADQIVVMDNGPHRAGRRAARAVRAPGERVRDELHRPGQPSRRRAGSGRTTSTSCIDEPHRGRDRGDDRARGLPGLRGPRRADCDATAATSGRRCRATQAERARAASGPDRLRARARRARSSATYGQARVEAASCRGLIAATSSGD